VPIYEYRCVDCSKRSSILLLSLSFPTPPTCPHCQSGRLERLLSRFASPKSDEARMESFADGALAGLDEEDPASVERLMKRMGNEMGDADMAQGMDSPGENGLEAGDDDGL
jgi:putative FmdB family regulatory protein